MNKQSLIDAFRTLRESWFNRVLRSYSHEREWEDDERGNYREERNKELKELYDKQTERIIYQGWETNSIVCPSCERDMRMGE